MTMPKLTSYNDKLQFVKTTFTYLRKLIMDIIKITKKVIKCIFGLKNPLLNPKLQKIKFAKSFNIQILEI
jgi:hypothetical protein